MSQEQETQEEPGRAWWQWWAPLAMIAVFLVLPPAIYQVVSGTVLLGLMGGLTVLIALIDAATFRYSWTIFCVAGIAYFAAMMLYFNEGTWIYLPVMVLLALGASKLGAKVGKR
ncbi:heme transporter [Corynebacterium accolens]|uniref:heme transporter n=1 Tax=Corynebacterium accolens TaxID=38284 RepID=UPI00266EDF7B|nr:heme transporter [Corynebacterium accolens]WKS64408.1 heme transporter [Corynebacterium accolens]